MKKYWPVALLLLGVLLIGSIFVLKSRNKELPVEEEENIPEVPFGQRPVVTLTPTEDGHYLVLNVSNLVYDAETLEYLLEYKTSAGETQGVSGRLDLSGQNSLERELLLGSESSGKFRYDEGVEEGTITLRYRDSSGKTTGKVASDFHLQKDPTKLTSLDGKFSATPEPSIGYFVTMSTMGLPGDAPGNIVVGPYGVFTSSEDSVTLTLDLTGSELYLWDGEWIKLEDGSTTSIGIFISL